MSIASWKHFDGLSISDSEKQSVIGTGIIISEVSG